MMTKTAAHTVSVELYAIAESLHTIGQRLGIEMEPAAAEVDKAISLLFDARNLLDSTH